MGKAVLDCIAELVERFKKRAQKTFDLKIHSTLKTAKVGHAKLYYVANLYSIRL
jgi:hypothetical protein